MLIEATALSAAAKERLCSLPGVGDEFAFFYLGSFGTVTSGFLLPLVGRGGVTGVSFTNETRPLRCGDQLQQAHAVPPLHPFRRNGGEGAIVAKREVIFPIDP